MTLDTHQLYRWAVQDPDTQVAVIDLIYQRVRGGARPLVLREDFAGTCAEAVAWVRADRNRRSVAVDLDPSALAWAQRRAERMLGDAADHVTFVQADVLAVAPPRVPAADLTAAMNFSLFYHHDRATLRDYLQHAHRALAPGGVLVFNAFGGPGAMRTGIVDRRRVVPAPTHDGDDAPPPFEYQWEQRRYDALTGRIECCIHFVVPDRDGNQTTLRDAFTYDWRLWTLPELTELTHEAGFTDVQVWRHTYDPAKGGEGVFLGAVDHIHNADTWVAYGVGIK